MNLSVLKHAGLKKWVDEAASLITPDSIEVCDGSQAEYDRMIKIMVDIGLAIPLKAKPNSCLFRSDPSDVACVENRTHIASKSKNDAGPTNSRGGLEKNINCLYEGSYYVCHQPRRGLLWRGPRYQGRVQF